ncbi:MAG: class I SAM-dependent RNA methyltransferase [Deltaproteobacteria bacterium]
MRVQIEKLAFGGAGVARAEGKVYFVRGALAGDTVEIQITRDRGRFAEARVLSILEPSPDRVHPPCPVFDVCGGCQWQNLGYASALRAKEGILRETLERVGGFTDDSIIEPIVPSPSQYAYRSRVMFSLWHQRGGYRIGFHEEASRARTPVAGCPVAVEAIEKAVFAISKTLAEIKSPVYPVDKIYIASDGAGAWASLLPKRRENPRALNPLRKILNRALKGNFVSIAGDDGEAEYELELLGLRFYSVPSTFIQANAEINAKLVAAALEWADLSGWESALDLYSGIGNFSLHLAKSAGRVLGVDIAAKSVSLARRAALANSIENVKFDPSPTELFIAEALQRGDKFDFVLLDPPREGAREILDGIAGLSPEKIIYVSCDPATLARDLKRLRDSGYRTLKIRPFDMFPQTYHIETLALLVRV